MKKIAHLILALFALPFVLLIRALSPFVIVRIFVLDLSRIGHVLMHFDLYVSRRNRGLEGPRNFDSSASLRVNPERSPVIHGRTSRRVDIFCFDQGPVANQQAKKMVERTIPICPFAFWVDKVNKRIPGWQKHVIARRSRFHCDLPEHAPPTLSFTREEIKKGQEALERLGVPLNHPFICFHARDDAYLKTSQPHLNWDYHSYRNADINNYLPSVEKLVNQGYYAIRMGRFVGKEIKTNNPKIIDYAKNGSDFLDLYLGAHCRFFIAGSDGLAEIPTLFRRPMVWIDFVPFSSLYLILREQFFIPKKLWLIQEKRMLTFDEMLHTEVADYGRSEDYKQAGIEVINNSPEEIVDVSMELEERLNGTWNETQEDQELQKKFENIVVKRVGRKIGRIGAKFLRQNSGLLALSKPARAHAAI